MVYNTHTRKRNTDRWECGIDSHGYMRHTHAHKQNNNDYIFLNENAIFQWFSMKVIADNTSYSDPASFCLQRKGDDEDYYNLLHLAIDASV